MQCPVCGAPSSPSAVCRGARRGEYDRRERRHDDDDDDEYHRRHHKRKKGGWLGEMFDLFD